MQTAGIIKLSAADVKLQHIGRRRLHFRRPYMGAHHMTHKPYLVSAYSVLQASLQYETDQSSRNISIVRHHHVY